MKERRAWEEARHSADYVTFDSRSKYSIRNEISPLPSPTIITGRRCTGCCTQLPLCSLFFPFLYFNVRWRDDTKERKKRGANRGSLNCQKIANALPNCKSTPTHIGQIKILENDLRFSPQLRIRKIHAQ